MLQLCTANLVPGSYSVSYRHLRGTGLKRLLLKFNFPYLRGVLGDFLATEHETNEEGQSCVVGISISEHTCHGLTLMKWRLNLVTSNLRPRRLLCCVQRGVLRNFETGALTLSSEFAEYQTHDMRVLRDPSSITDPSQGNETGLSLIND